MDKLSALFSKLKNIKHIEIIIGAAALVTVLAVYFMFVSCSGSGSGSGADNKKAVDLSGTDYCTAMQIQLENTVSEIAGVGSCSVVINWDKSVPVSTGFGAASTENPKPLGALIVCDGGNSTKVKLDVMFAVSTLLDLSIEKIIVYPKNTKNQEAI